MGRRDKFMGNVNPATIRIEWKGKSTKGFFAFYDKENKCDVEIGGIRFAVLAERHSVGGFSERHKTGLYSNEVDRIGEEELVLKKFENGKPVELCRGIYKQLGKELSYEQAGYQKVVYAVVLDCDQIKTGTIVRFILSGASASAWFEVKQADKLDGVKLTGFVDLKKGDNNYRAPTFGPAPISDEEDDIAEAACDAVDAYIKGGSIKKAAPIEAQPTADLPVVDDIPYGDDEDAPF